MSDLAEIAGQTPAFDCWSAVAQVLEQQAVGCLGEVEPEPAVLVEEQVGELEMQDELRHQH